MRDDARANTNREAVSVRRAAAILDVHEDTVYNLIKTKKLIAFRVGRAIRIYLADLRTFRRENLT